ncbi:MAG: alternative ribosome rescue aminoacyl-tRNA hydrolase ArfB, partial [Acidimicrobiia bacterium]
ECKARRPIRAGIPQDVRGASAQPVITLSCMDDLEVGRHTIPGAELEEIFVTSGGPGGQHANRNETAVRLRLDVAASSLPSAVKAKLSQRIGEVVEVVASDSRSQFRNRALARKRLRAKLEEALVDKSPRRRTRPTRASRQRRVAEKRARGEVKRLRRSPKNEE